MKVFWSYANRDNPKPHNVTLLREAFEGVLGQCVGADVRVFQDESGLKWGDDWRRKLEEEVTASNVFVCLLSPSYIASKMCIQELVWAMESHVAVHPILYRACKKGMKCSFSEESDSNVKKLNEFSRELEKLQYVDFTPLRNKPKDSPEVLDFLDRICEEIA